MYNISVIQFSKSSIKFHLLLKWKKCRRWFLRNFNSRNCLEETLVRRPLFNSIWYSMLLALISFYIFFSALPDNVFPLFMTSKTQEIYNCKCDEDVTEENPFKFIPKPDILQDMQMRAAVCDFHPFKQQILVSFLVSKNIYFYLWFMRFTPYTFMYMI